VAGYFNASTTENEERNCPISIALTATQAPPDGVRDALAQIVTAVVSSGGSVVVSDNSPLALESRLSILDPWHATLGYGECFSTPGLHVMETPTKYHVETLTGLGATGVDVIVAYVGDQSRQGHPLVPMVQIGAHAEVADVDLTGDQPDLAGQLAALVPRIVSGEHRTKASELGNTDFQMTRGLLGVSL